MKAQTIICGAGIAGISAAYYLAVKHGQKNILLLDRNMPMSLTTSKSGENYRDYWPQPVMTEFATHSMDLMEEIQAIEDNHGFTMHGIGYDFVSENSNDVFPSSYAEAEIDQYLARITNKQEIESTRPYLADSVDQVVHIHRAGEMDVNALGSFMLREAKKAGVKFQQTTIKDLQHIPDGGFTIHADQEYNCDQLVIAAGPFSPNLAAMLGLQLPLENILQRKFVIPDPANVIPENIPFTIFADPQKLDWTDEELELINDQPEFAHLLAEFPEGLHIKPVGSSHIKMGWAFNREPSSPEWDPASNDEFVEIVMRGATRFIPGLTQYLASIPTPIVHYSGYYTRTPENLPLIGNTEYQDLFLMTGFAGYGTMSACAAGELLANIMGQYTLPGYARYLAPGRYDNAQLMSELSAISSDGQL
ncbi:MAG: FAD-dependent oxidoreductase [Pseudomonadota bacterium]